MATVTEIPLQPLGWGIDADIRNDPTYPIKKRTDSEQAGYTWERPTQQPPTVEVLHSNERPNLTAAYGTASPPSGLSGMLRRFAFRHSESTYAHWLPLMLADRINMVEGILDDLLRGRIPNIPAELGWPAEWRFNRTRFLIRVTIELAIWTAVGAAVVAVIRRGIRGARPRSARLR